ncbi:DUF4870 domain-containing protein [Balneolales bacterium ANBcel1]|nr:DUF4870 domain-containing protein [Balneolales bacterium ANBcel1]
MLYHTEFPYSPDDTEREKASNSYLISLIAIIAGAPMPFVNLLATLIFYLGNRKGAYFTRWHCTQAMMSQITLFFVNAAAVGWTVHIFIGGGTLTNVYIAYLITALLVNLIEFVMTIYTAIATRRGRHIEWWFWGALANTICKPERSTS